MNCICTLCGRDYVYSRGKGHTKTKCNSCLTNRGRFALKDKIVAYLGGRCQRCGYDRCSAALTAHHRDPTEKKFKISGNHNRSWVSIRGELDKCDLLCANCHAELHWAERELVL